MTDRPHAVVTGGGKGIGAAVARALDARGQHVTLMGRDMAALDDVAAQLDAAQAVRCDVADPSQVDAAFAQAAEAFGPISVLVNNAGIATSSPFAKLTRAEFQRVLAVNLLGAFACAQAVVPGMLAQGFGRIVNVASTAGLHGYPYITAYAASKHALVGLTRCLGLELAGRGVTCNAVCPGYTDTAMARQAIEIVVNKTGRSQDQARAMIERDNPQGRLIAPEEVAEAVAWLCSPEAGGVTGEAIQIA